MGWWNNSIGKRTARRRAQVSLCRIEQLEKRQLLAVDVFDMASLLPENGGDGSKGAAFLGIENDRLGNFSGQGKFGAGDINGDGFDDLAFIKAANEFGPTAAYVLFGSADGIDPAVDLDSLTSDQGMRIDGFESFDITPADRDRLGGHARIDVVGDTNGDGYDDVVLNTPLLKDATGALRGGAFVVYGDATLSTELDLSNLSAGAGYRLELPVGTPGFDDTREVGLYVGGVGDVDNNGLADFLISTPGDQSSFTGSIVVLGSTSIPEEEHLNLAELTEDRGFYVDFSLIHTDKAQPSHGDLNGDGIDDIVFGWGMVRFGMDSTQSPNPFGSRISMLTPSFADSYPGLPVMQQGDGFYFNVGSYQSISLSGDIDGDGVDDLLVGDFRTSYLGRTRAGSVRVLLGRDVANESGFPLEFDDTYQANHGFTIYGSQSGADFGIGVGTLPDANGDGRDEIVVAAYRRAESDYNDGPFSNTYVIDGRESFPAEVDTALLNDGDATIYQGGQGRGSVEGIATVAPDFNGDGSSDLLLANPSGSWIDLYLVHGNAAGSIEDPLLSISDVAVVVEDSGTAVVAFELEVALSADVSVDYATTSGTAVAGIDFPSAIGTLTIPAGQTTATLELAVTPDSEVENDEVFGLVLSNPTGVRLPTTYVTATIDNDDFGAIDDFESATETGGVGEWIGEWNSGYLSRLTSSRGPNDGTQHFEIRKDSVLVREVNSSGATDLKLSFASKLRKLESIDTVSVLVSPDGANWTTLASFGDGDDDNVYRDYTLDIPFEAESFWIYFQAAMDDTNDFWYVDSVEVEGTYDSDGQPVLTARAENAPAVMEGESVEVRVLLDQSADREVQFAYVADENAPGDIIDASGTLTFAPGEFEKIITIQTIDDGLTEDAETVQIVLTSLSANTQVNNSDGKFFILDDEDLLTFTAGPNASYNEGDDLAYTVTLDSTSIFPVELSYRQVTFLSGDKVAATYGEDFGGIPVQGTVRFEPGELTKSITFTGLVDSLVEGDEVVRIIFQNVQGASSSTNAVTTHTIVDQPPVPAGPKLAHGVVASVGSSWQTVSLGQSFESAVIVATPRYDDGSAPGVVRISNVTADSFDVRIDDVGPGSFSGGIHFIALEEGVYDVPGQYKLEAVKVDAVDTSSKTAGWKIKTGSYQQSYTNPVVVGQVMSTNDENWSVFWSSSNKRTNPATASYLNVGKHVGEDPDSIRVAETLGYFVIESTSSGSIDGLSFSAGIGADSVRGVGNGISRYDGVTPANVSTVVLSTAGMDGGDGGWAALMGMDPLSSGSGSIDLAIDEDQRKDSERKHTTEQVAFFAIGESYGTALNAHHTASRNGKTESVTLDTGLVLYSVEIPASSGQGDMSADDDRIEKRRDFALVAPGHNLNADADVHATRAPILKDCSLESRGKSEVDSTWEASIDLIFLDVDQFVLLGDCEGLVKPIKTIH